LTKQSSDRGRDKRHDERKNRLMDVPRRLDKEERPSGGKNREPESEGDAQKQATRNEETKNPMSYNIDSLPSV
jgi:hypothetical protein